MKHLQSNLSTLFRSSLPDVPSTPLPSGPAYIRPMSIAAIKASIVWEYNPYNATIIAIPPDNLPTLFSYDNPTNSANILSEFTRWIAFRWHGMTQKRFRTSDIAYIAMFLDFPRTRLRLPNEFTRLYNQYPEYFI